MEEEFVKGLLKQAYLVYFKVVGKFPEIKVDEMRVGYDPSFTMPARLFTRMMSQELSYRGHYWSQAPGFLSWKNQKRKLLLRTNWGIT